MLETADCTSLACLRDLSFEELRNATQRSYFAGWDADLYGYGDTYYKPVVDGSFVKDLPSRQLANGNFTRVPILVDTDEFEGMSRSNDI